MASFLSECSGAFSSATLPTSNRCHYSPHVAQFATTTTSFPISLVIMTVEYMPLASISPAAHDDDELDILKPGDWVAPQSGIINTSRTALTWLTILMGIMATLAAAAFHITILSETSGLQSIRSPNDVISTLKMVRPSPNLEKGRANIKQWKKVKGESRGRGSCPYLLTCSSATNGFSPVHRARKCSRAKYSLPIWTICLTQSIGGCS
jgi:hypothetical protein